MASSRPRSFGLDLLRAGAIAMVLVSHGGAVFASWWGRHPPPHLAVAGYFGVEAFFVLSGFLIGEQLLALAGGEPGAGTLGGFMRRRWARTLPLYAATLAVLALAAPPGDGAHTVAIFAVFAQNLAWPTVGFWFPVSWSLAVEEWFYLLFPLLLIPAVRRIGRFGGVGTTLAVFLLVPLALRLGAVPRGTDWNDVTRQVVVLRLDAIAFGVATAALCRSTRTGATVARWRHAWAAGGLLVIAVQWWGGLQGTGPIARAVHDAFAFDVTDGAWALTLPWLARLRTPGRAATLPVHAIAARSYGLYLTHLSVLDLCGAGIASHALDRKAAVAVALALGALVPTLSWSLLERPILDGWGRARRAPPPSPLPAFTPGRRPG